MKTLLCLMLLACAGCGPMTPEQRANVSNAFNQARVDIDRQRELNQQYFQAQMMQNMSRPLYQPQPMPPTYMVRPSGNGDLMISPTGY